VRQGLEFVQSLASYRRNLELQLRRAHTVLWWYLAPLSCGPAVLMFGIAHELANPWPIVMRGVAGFAVIWGLVLYMYRRSAEKLRRRIEQLDATAQKS
jgi:nitrate reductase gamma subunit